MSPYIHSHPYQAPLPRRPQSWEVSHVWLPPHSQQLSLATRVDSSSPPAPSWCPTTAVTADPTGEENGGYPPTAGIGQPGTHHQPPPPRGPTRWGLPLLAHADPAVWQLPVETCHVPRGSSPSHLGSQPGSLWDNPVLSYSRANTEPLVYAD